MLLGEAQVQNGDMEGARATLDEVIKLAGLQSEAGKKAYLARLFTHREKPENALAELVKTSETLRVAPDLARDMQTQMGVLYAITEQPEKAKEHFKLMMKNAPTEEEVVPPMEMLVRVYMDEKKYDDALAVYEKNLAAYPKSEMRGSYLYAIGAMHRQIADSSADPAVKAREEQAAIRAFEESEAFIRKQMASEPLERRKTGHLIQLSKVFRGKGEPAQADALLTATLNQTKTTEVQLDLLSELIRANDERRDLPGVRRWLQEVAQRFPGTEHAQAALQGIGQIDQMIKQGVGTTTGTLQRQPRAADKPASPTLDASGATTETLSKPEAAGAR